MRTGNKTPAMTVKTSVKTGSTNDNTKAHTTDCNKTVSGGQAVHGMPLMSAAAAKQSY